MHFELTKEYIAELKKIILDHDEGTAIKLMKELHAAEMLKKQNYYTCCSMGKRLGMFLQN